MITKRQIKQAFGLTTDVQVAALFENPATGKPITRAAIHQWKDDESIPAPREWQLRCLHPDKFPAQAA